MRELGCGAGARVGLAGIAVERPPMGLHDVVIRHELPAISVLRLFGYSESNLDMAFSAA